MHGERCDDNHCVRVKERNRERNREIVELSQAIPLCSHLQQLEVPSARTRLTTD